MNQENRSHSILERINGELLIQVVVILLSVGSFFYFYQTGMIAPAGDRASHINIPRRVFDNLTPGLANLVSYWLPLLYLLQLPFIWLDSLWRTGIAGSIVSMASFILASWYFYKLAKLLLKDKVSALLALAIFVTNPHLLFLQSSAQFEPLLVCTFVISIYYIAEWVMDSENNRPLILSAFITSLAVLVRYDNWMLVPVLALIVSVVVMRKTKNRDAVEAHVLTFLLPVVYTIFLFVFANLLLQGDPFYFLHPSYQEFIVEGNLVVGQTDPAFTQYSKYKPGISLLRFVLASAHNVGFIIYIFSIVGMIAFILRNKLSNQAMITYALFAPYVFFWALLFFRGQPPILVPELPPYNTSTPYWDVRYAISSLPATAMVCGYLAKRLKRSKWLLSIIIVLQLLLFAIGNRFYISQAPTLNANLRIKEEDRIFFVWINDNLADEDDLILMSTWKAGEYVSGDTIIINSGLQNRQVIHEGTQRYWRESLVNPGKYADWIITKKNDKIDRLIESQPLLFDDFKQIYESQNGNYEIYQKKEEARTR
jgi:hypothetical protein